MKVLNKKTAATLVVGMTFTPTTPSAFALNKGAHDNVIGNDNTDDDTIQKQKCQQFSEAFNAALDLDCAILNNSNNSPAGTPPVENPPPEEEACNPDTIGFVALYDVTLEGDLGGVVVIGDELCLSGDGAGDRHDVPFGIQDAFDVTHPSSSPFPVLVLDEPVSGCSNLGQAPRLVRVCYCNIRKSNQ